MLSTTFCENPHPCTFSRLLQVLPEPPLQYGMITAKLQGRKELLLWKMSPLLSLASGQVHSMHKTT